MCGFLSCYFQISERNNIHNGEMVLNIACREILQRKILDGEGVAKIAFPVLLPFRFV